MELSKYIALARKEKKLTLRELASISDVSHPYISQLERGKNKKPAPDVLKKLSAALDIDYRFLMFLAGYEDKLGTYMYRQRAELQKRIEKYELEIDDILKENTNKEGLKNDTNYIHLLKKHTDNSKMLKHLEEDIKEFESYQTAKEKLSKGEYLDWAALDKTLDLKKISSKTLLIEQAIENYKENITTPIYLNDKNEGNFEFFNDEGVIDESTQQKIKDFIKILLRKDE